MDEFRSRQVKFSVIVPTYNRQDSVEKAVSSVLRQTSLDYEIEIILVDDHSNDKTMDILTNLRAKHGNISLLETPRNLGPGAARNMGMKASTGDWILFLDSDDSYTDGALNSLYESMKHEDFKPELLCFNWRYDKESDSTIHGWDGRDDLDLLGSGNKENILNGYLLNRVDGSCIYSVFTRRFLFRHGLFFREGYHEDVDFMFSCFYHTGNIKTSSKVLYEKNNRIGSIVNTITLDHLHGYFEGLKAICDLLKKQDAFARHSDSFMTGVVNITASRIVRACREGVEERRFPGLLSALYESVVNIFDHAGRKYVSDNPAPFKTKYRQIFEYFLSFMNSSERDQTPKFKEHVSDLVKKSWSCYDLQNSVFLAPDEIRTCCKRFFHENKMKGDVVLIRQDQPGGQISFRAISEAKKKTIREINRDNFEPCRGCPYLQFNDWGDVLERGVKYLSFEYHSICNMRCEYCSELFYGGKKPAYDVDALLDEMIRQKTLVHCDYVVWGGGEPTLDKHFDDKLAKTSKAIPKIKQRVITNSTKFSGFVAALLSEDKAFVVTSIDAGTQKTFEKIRGYKNLSGVMSNLQSYAKISPANIVIKYIVRSGNDHYEELVSFVQLIKQYGLCGCNFQISCDFKTSQLFHHDTLAIAQLYGLLLDADVRYVFLDDLVWQRMPVLDDAAIVKLENDLGRSGFSNIRANDDTGSRDVVVWGTGAQAKLVISKANYFSKHRIDCFIDPRKESVGKSFCDKKIFDPAMLKEKDLPVVIVAVQSAPFIYTQYLNMGLPMENVVKKLIL